MTIGGRNLIVALQSTHERRLHREYRWRVARRAAAGVAAVLLAYAIVPLLAFPVETVRAIWGVLTAWVAR